MNESVLPLKKKFSQHNVGGDDLKKNRTTRKRMVSPDDTVIVNGHVVFNLAGNVAGTILMIEEGATATSTDGASATPEKEPIENQRMRQGDEVDMDERDLSNVAVWSMRNLF